MIERLLRKEMTLRLKFLEEREKRDEAEKRTSRAFEKLQEAKKELREAGFKGNIMRGIRTLEELKAANPLGPARCDEQEWPVEGSFWRHRNGNVYQVTGYTNLHSVDHNRYPVMIVYRGNNGRVWSRPVSDWYRSFAPEETPQTGGEE